MAVFDNLKNFIRQGKQASQKAQVNKSSTRTSIDSKRKRDSVNSTSQLSEHSTSQNSGHSGTSHEKEKSKRKYDQAVKQIIQEENENKHKMPELAGLEDYRLVEKMGDGAFSIVYKAIEIESGESRAIKAVSKRNITSSQRASVLKEAAIMRQLEHPSIVHMYEFLDTPDYYFIVLELVNGGELFHQIVHLTYFSEDLSRHVIVQVAEAIRYLHEVAGVVHRDIKPENLLFTKVPHVPSKRRSTRPGDDEGKEDEGEFSTGVGGGGVGTIKLADFGLSKIIWDAKTMTPCGTVGYTAPEIVKDEKYSKSVDMWALGCVLYTILCGFPPFYDESIEVLTHKVAMGQYAFLSPWWDGISDSAKDLVSHLLTVDPEKRYTIDQFLNHPWITQKKEKILTNEEVKKHTMPSTPLHENLESTRSGAARSGALRDAFDVSNAVYRLEEEVNRRNHRHHHMAILEDEEAEFDEGAQESTQFAHIEHAVENLHVDQGQQPTKGAQVGSQRAATKRMAAAVSSGAGTMGQQSFFDLHLDGSTLLERRKARQTPVAH